MRKRILSLLPLALLFAAMLCTPGFALTESEVQAQVAATSREAVTGNVLIWFLCAVAFLKVSQKIDSFMASMGVNVGRTGGSLMAEAMIAARGISMLIKAGGGAVGGLGRAAGGSSGGAAPGSPGTTGGFFKGGLIGMAGRHITNSAVKTATTQTSAVHTAQNQARQATAAAAATQTASNTNIKSAVHTGGSSIHNQNSTVTGTPSQSSGIGSSGGVYVPAAPMENIPSAGSMPDGIPPQEGVIVTGCGESASAVSVENAPFAGPLPNETPSQDGGIDIHGDASIPAAPIENAPSAGSMPDQIPPQEGVIVTSGSESMPAAPIENAPPAGSMPDQIPSQEGVIVTSGSMSSSVTSFPAAGPVPNGMPPQERVTDGSGGVSAPAAPIENAPSNGTISNGMPPQEGVIVTGGVSAPAGLTENAPSAGPMPDGIPPQDGVTLTDSEAPPSIPVNQAPQVDSTPSESVPVDAPPPQGGVVITGGNTAIHTSQTQSTVQNSPSGSGPRGNAAVTGGQRAGTHTERTAQTVHTASSGRQTRSGHSQSFGTSRPTLGGMAFSRSLVSGGKFANDVIGTVAKGDIRSTGSITGDLAAQSLSSYMGYTALGSGTQDIPRYSDVEIGGGRITGTEIPAGSQEGLAFGMYHAAQYTAPEGPYEKVYSADDTLWYRQYAQDAVERKPYKAPDGTVAYEERIVKKLPAPPKRKDRI